MENKTPMAEDLKPVSSEGIVLPYYKPWSLAKFFPGPAPTNNPSQLSSFVLAAGVNVCSGAVLMLSGWNLALFGGVSSNPDYLAVVGLEEPTSRNQLLIGVINSCYFVGVITGALLCGNLSDKVGRRKSLFAGGLFGCLVVPLLAATQNFTWTLILRILNGVTTGCMDAAGLTWTAEIAAQHHRGRMISIMMSFAAGGASTVYFMLYGLGLHSTGAVVWRLPIAFQLVYIISIMAAVFLLPESPRWLVKVNMIDEARKVLYSLHPKQDSTDMYVEKELDAIVQSHVEGLQNANSITYWRMFLVPDGFSTVRRTWSALFVQFSTQFFIGASFVAGYGIQIFITGGWSPQLASILAGAGIITQSVFGLFGILFSENMGRRFALVGGAFAGCVLLALIGMCGYFVDKNNATNSDVAKQYGIGTIVLLLLWSAQFGATWLWCPFTYPSEIFPLRHRARGSSVGIVGFAMGAFVCNMVSTYLFNALGYKTMFLLAGTSAFVGIVCFLFMPETAGKSLEEIEYTFMEKNLQF